MSNESVRLSLTKFKAGTYITIEGKTENDYFFIIRSGKVRLVNTTTNQEETAGGTRVLGPGDFFGVVGAITGHPCMESTQALENVELIAVKKNQFGFLIQKNAPFVMKIIRSFSVELREFDKLLAAKTQGSNQYEENPDNLYHSAQYYDSKNNLKAATYQYSQYVKIHPNRPHVADAQKRLNEIGDEQIQKYQAKTEFNRTYEDGEMLFSEGEAGHELFIIQSGKVKITKITADKEILIAVLNPGDILGEMALLDNKDRVASAISFGPSSVTAVNQDNFNRIVTQNITLATRLITILSERVWTIYKQLANLMISDPLSRLYDTLLTQLLKKYVPIKPRTSYTFPFGIEELKTMVGFDKEDDEKPSNNSSKTEPSVSKIIALPAPTSPKSIKMSSSPCACNPETKN